MPEQPRKSRPEVHERKLVHRLLSQTRSTSVGIYPHDIHPGLVPGISVDDQRNLSLIHI